MKFFDHLIDFLVFGFSRKKEDEPVEMHNTVVKEEMQLNQDVQEFRGVIDDLIDAVNNNQILPDFDVMTKLEIDIWARDTLSLKLDRRKAKAHMIEQIQKHLDKEN